MLIACATIIRLRHKYTKYPFALVNVSEVSVRFSEVKGLKGRFTSGKILEMFAEAEKYILAGKARRHLSGVCLGQIAPNALH